MALDFSSLAGRKLLVVTGKGGAGKSVLALALAHRLSLENKRVWLVELGRKRDQEFSRLPELLGRTKLSHERTSITLPSGKQKIFASLLNPTQSLAEYVSLKLPVGGLAGVLLNNRVTASFLEVVPGLPDLVQMGKLWHSVTQEKDGPDVIVLDAPATGHAIALLRAAENFKRITRVGPIHRDATLMVEFFRDPAQTGIVLAALPEEMSVQETMELKKNLKDFPPPHVYVNKCFPELPKVKVDTPENAVWRAYRYSEARARREREAVKELKGAHLLPFFFPEPASPPLFLRISEAIT